MARLHDPEKFRFQVTFHERSSGRIVGEESITAPNQFQALIRIYRMSLRYDARQHYIVVKCDGCKTRPEFLIKNLRRYGINVIEPEQYPSGEKGVTFNKLKHEGFLQ
jgi:hypothetical protein